MKRILVTALLCVVAFVAGALIVHRMRPEVVYSYVACPLMEPLSMEDVDKINAGIVETLARRDPGGRNSAIFVPSEKGLGNRVYYIGHAMDFGDKGSWTDAVRGFIMMYVSGVNSRQEQEFYRKEIHRGNTNCGTASGQPVTNEK